MRWPPSLIATTREFPIRVKTVSREERPAEALVGMA
jgi:hypothetical protein